MKTRQRLEAIALLLDIADTMAGVLELDRDDRMLVVSIHAGRLKSRWRRGPTLSSLARTVRLPVETARRKLNRMVEAGVIVKLETGFDLVDTHSCNAALDAVLDIASKRVERARSDPETPRRRGRARPPLHPDAGMSSG